VSGLAARSGAFIASYVAAAAVAAVFYTLLLVISVQVVGVAEPSDMSIAMQLQMLVWFAVMVALFIMTLGFLPSVLAVLLLTMFGLKDVVSHALAGVAVAAVAVMFAARHVLFLDRMTFDWTMALTGAVAGSAFWAVRRQLARETPARA